MENVDRHIEELIEELARRAQNWSTSDEERAQLVAEIAKLRSSMNPTIVNMQE